MKAVILAAGLGSRLAAGPGGWSKPKGLLQLGPETLVQRSLRLLRAQGLEPITLVVGHLAQDYQPLGCPMIHNHDYATTGSLRSLLLAHRQLQCDLLVLESDLLYEERALLQVLRSPHPDLILASGFTTSGDEVWVEAPQGRLRTLSKSLNDLAGPPLGEFVGISRFSSALLERLQAWGQDHPQAHYDSQGLTALASEWPIAVEHIEDLVWCEVDDAQHWHRCQQVIWPQLEGRT